MRHHPAEDERRLLRTLGESAWTDVSILPAHNPEFLNGVRVTTARGETVRLGCATLQVAGYAFEHSRISITPPNDEWARTHADELERYAREAQAKHPQVADLFAYIPRTVAALRKPPHWISLWSKDNDPHSALVHFGKATSRSMSLVTERKSLTDDEANRTGGFTISITQAGTTPPTLRELPGAFELEWTSGVLLSAEYAQLLVTCDPRQEFAVRIWTLPKAIEQALAGKSREPIE